MKIYTQDDKPRKEVNKFGHVYDHSNWLISKCERGHLRIIYYDFLRDYWIEQKGEILTIYKFQWVYPEDVFNQLHFTKNDIDLAYFTGVFNVSGIDGTSNELDRLKEINKSPCDIFQNKDVEFKIKDNE